MAIKGITVLDAISTVFDLFNLKKANDARYQIYKICRTEMKC
jgi:hypothetical protein